MHFLQDQEFGGGGHGPDEEGGTMRYGGNGAYGEWAVDENATNFNETEAWNGRNGNTFRQEERQTYIPTELEIYAFLVVSFCL